MSKLGNLPAALRSQPQTLRWGLVLGCLIAGSCLRLIWPGDMEWKDDEIWMYETARRVVTGAQPWPTLGMVSSTGLHNPGLSVWCFIVITAIAPTPIAMVQGVQVLNVLALWLTLGFTLWQIPADRPDRQIWLRGLALASVSPLAIVFSRKLWAQDLLPIFCVGLWSSHWFRRTGWGAFGWGLVGALIGQVHLSGCFLAAGLFVWTLYHDWRQRSLRQIRWVPWGLGTLLGLVPFMPWFSYLLGTADSAGGRSWLGVLVPKFFIHWVTTSLGINLSYALGAHFWSDFLPQPVIGGVPTYLIAIAHLFLVGAGLWGLGRWIRICPQPLTTLVRTLPNPGLGFYLQAAGLVTGVIFTLFALNVPIHYLIVTFPFIYCWLASLLADRPGVFWAMVFSQLAIAVTFLSLIHTTGGFPDADYGVVYRLQDYRP